MVVRVVNQTKTKGIKFGLRKTHLFLALLIVGLGVGAFLVRCWNHEQIFIQGQIFFVDADCYSRMTRVEKLVDDPFRSIRFHDFENAPQGVTPHTTVPMEWVILLLRAVLNPFQSDALNLAGAYISPLLGALLMGFLTWWSFRLGLAWRWPLLLLVLFSPILTHGFLLGRPDHQSLILLLIGVAWAAETALWSRPSLSWQVLSAVAWGLALWTSLFEPLILLFITLGLRVLVLGRQARPDLRAVAVFIVILLSGFIFDGWRAQSISAERAEWFRHWSKNIGELRPTSLAQMMRWTGWLLVIAPVLLIIRFVRQRDRVALAWGILLLVLIILSLWYMRWGYFLALAFAFSLPTVLATIRWKAAAGLAFAVSLFPLAQEWDSQLFPDASQQAYRTEAKDDALRLREVASALVSPKSEIILAPWWLSPPLAYWSGQKCVSGSSHQSLPGTVDTATFYLATDWTEARRILKDRQVNFIVAYEPSRVLSNSAQILNQPLPRNCVGAILYQSPERTPGFLRLAYTNEYFKVYEFLGL